MPVIPSRSSKEWSASALERDREAETQAARQQLLQSQLAALQAQLKEAQENEIRIKEEAAINRQQAKNEEFHEISLAQQGKFRGMFADDTFTRVAQALAEGGFASVVAISEGRTGELLTEFKATLWEAVAGDDSIFLQQAAQKIASRYSKSITDEDILAIRNSVSCLSANFVAIAQQQESQQNVAQEHPSEPTGAVQVRNFPIKLEDQGPEKGNAMDVVEQDTMHAARSASIAASDINIQLTDPLGNTITGEEHNLIERTPTMELEPGTPISTTRKRLIEDEGTPAPSEVDDTNTPKKRKTTRAKSTAKSPIADRFGKHIEARFTSGDLRDHDLACSVCGKEAEKPRVATQCLHVYCNHCFTEHKGNAKGKELHKVICARGDCDRAVGVMSGVAEETIAKLKETFISKNELQGIHGSTDV